MTLDVFLLKIILFSFAESVVQTVCKKLNNFLTWMFENWNENVQAKLREIFKKQNSGIWRRAASVLKKQTNSSLPNVLCPLRVTSSSTRIPGDFTVRQENSVNSNFTSSGHFDQTWKFELSVQNLRRTRERAKKSETFWCRSLFDCAWHCVFSYIRCWIHVRGNWLSAASSEKYHLQQVTCYFI